MLVYISADASEYALRNEAFGPVLAIMRLPCDKNIKGAPCSTDFLKKAVVFCNGSIWGSLSCTVLAHPSVPTDAVDEAIGNLKYGAIGLNCWTARCFGVEALPWGAYPGEQMNNVQSGIGFVRNAYGVDHPLKGVLRSPFISKQHLGCDSIALTIHGSSGICGFSTQGGLWNLLKMLCYPGCCCCCRDPTGVATSDYSNAD